MTDAVETGAFFVVRFHREPRRFGDVGMGKHGVLSLGILHEGDRAIPNPSDSACNGERDRWCETGSGETSAHMNEGFPP